MTNEENKILKEHILSAITEIRIKKKRPDFCSIYYVVLCLLYFWYSVIFDYFCNDFIVDLFTENKEIVIIIIVILFKRV